MSDGLVPYQIAEQLIKIIVDYYDTYSDKEEKENDDQKQKDQ